MQVKLKLFATLTDYLPPNANRNEVVLSVDEAVSISHVIDQFNLPRHLVHLVLVNGLYVYPQERTMKTLHDGDVLAIWPPIAGG
jgi:molybdopterin converting factor small subunit